MLQSLQTARLTRRIALAPVPNMLNSMALLHQLAQLPALAQWVRHSAAELTLRQLATNRLLWQELRAAVLPEGSWADVPAYLAALAVEQPETMRARVATWREHNGLSSTPSPIVDALLADPRALHDLVVAHLHELWEALLAPKWAHTQRELQKQADLLSRSSVEAGIAPAAIAAHLDAYIGAQAAPTEQTEELVYVPSPHTGRYVTQLAWGRVLYLFFDAELHAGVLLRESPIKQLELIARLSALAEPARLRVLELLAQHEELSLQELMALLDTSQPNVSRYLKALGGFVREQRGKDGRKRYRLLPSELDATFRALKRMVLAPPAPATQQEPAMEDLEVVRYIDAQGAVFVWPRQPEQLQIVLGYIAGRFAPDTTYAEREVNELLQQVVPPHVRDHLNVRRDLIDAGLIERSSNGAQYWRASETQAQPQRELTDEEAYDRYWGGELPETDPRMDANTRE